MEIKIKMEKIELGDQVKCKYTGFKGVIVAKTEFINGCVQFSVVPKWDGKSPIMEEMSIDEGSLEIIKKRKKEVEEDYEDEEENGGSMRRILKQRGY